MLPTKVLVGVNSTATFELLLVCFIAVLAIRNVILSCPASDLSICLNRL